MKMKRKDEIKRQTHKRQTIYRINFKKPSINTEHV